MDDTNQGVLFRNKKRTEEKQPTHTGWLNYNDTDYWLACWPHREEKGVLSLKATVKDETSQEEPVAFLLKPYESGTEKSPAYKGVVFGASVSCWINEMTRDTAKMKKGDVYLSIKLTPPEGAKKPEKKEKEVLDDHAEIPF